MLKGFKDFILRGNVIELSIAVVVGTAFTALVSAFTSNIVNPIIAAAGGVETKGLGFWIWPGNDKTFVNFGAVITAFVTFMITAAVVYFIFVAPMNRINHLVKKRLATAEPEEEALPADTALLAEIRDLLAQLAGADPGRTSGHNLGPAREHTAEAAGQRSI
ncbi:large conductance mechanosensitive channel protein MscL [Pseudarthrobacter sp. PvP090]|uniref:large conductance mechanosensitive channel protein MscL n=1 Tax=Pseudarthrobacter sp. PvP090 TaxID=3156393 RepID=UPI0033995A2B